MTPDTFYEWHEEPRQGDIVLCGVTRIIAADRYMRDGGRFLPERAITTP